MNSLPAGSEWPQLRAGLHDAEDGIAGNHADDVRAIFCSAYNRHLIYVRGEEPLEEAEQWLLRRSPQDFFAGNHGGLNRIVSPFFARDGVEHVDIHQADKAVIRQD